VFASAPFAVVSSDVHVVVVGCGRVGSGVAAQLEGQGHTVAVVDRAKRSFDRLPPDFKGTTIVGSGFDREALDAAGTRGAGALAAVTNGDNSNILCARIARENYGIANVVARIYDPRRAVIYQRLGIPTVATVSWTATQVLRWLTPDDDSVEWRDATGALLLVERILPDHWAGRHLTELEETGRFKVSSIIRSNQPRVDVTALIGQEDDVIQFVVLRDALVDLDARLAKVP
jgi:trk system potassium uptake protein